MNEKQGLTVPMKAKVGARSLYLTLDLTLGVGSLKGGGDVIVRPANVWGEGGGEGPIEGSRSR